MAKNNFSVIHRDGISHLFTDMAGQLAAVIRNQVKKYPDFLETTVRRFVDLLCDENPEAFKDKKKQFLAFYLDKAMLDSEIASALKNFCAKGRKTPLRTFAKKFFEDADCFTPWDLEFPGRDGDERYGADDDDYV